MPGAREHGDIGVAAARSDAEISPGAGRFPGRELSLACALALVLRLLYFAGASKSPLFTHPILEEVVVPVPRLVPCFLDVGSVFLLGATAWTMWGRRTAILASFLAALYGPLIYFQAEPVFATTGFFFIALFLYLSARAIRSGATRWYVVLGFLLAAATIVELVWGGAAAPGAAHVARSPGPILENLILTWNRRENPCGLDQRFLTAHNSPMFRIPWLLSFAFIGPIALVSAWAERRRAPLWSWYFGCVSVAIAAAQVCDRTRLPLLAAAIPLAGAGLDRFLSALARAARTTRSNPAAALLEVARAQKRTLFALGCATALVMAPFPGIQRTRSGEGWAALGRAYEESGSDLEAMRAYAEAERQGLRSAELYASWGSLEQRVRQGVEAEKHLLTAVDMDPGNATAHLALGDVYLERGTLTQAAQEYQVAAQLLPSRAAELYTRAGDAYEEALELEHAASMFRRALEKRPDYEPARRGLLRVREGTPQPEPVRMFPPLVR